LLFDDHAELRRIDDRRPTPGLAQPDWHEIDLGALDARITTSPATTARHRLVLRLGLVARAVGAARRTWELALDHAKQRVAFGHRIGSFQAVSHRAVDGATELTAAELIIAEAAAALIAERPDTLLAVELAVEFARNAASTVQFGAQYTLAATGYFDEHDAPWLFRRVHADLARLDHYAPPEGAIADVLLRGADLPVLDLGADAEAFRLEIREFLRPFALQASVTGFGQAPSDEYLRSAVERGYVTMAWPVEFGGRDATVEQQIVMAEELAYYRLPLMAKTAADLLGTAVIRHGTPDQQKRVLPLIAAGELPFYLGYSEPEVGSDLANLRTVAVRDGDDWIVNGRKMWGTGADTAQWVWLAARTAPTASSPQAGITVFLTRVDRPGWESQHHRALSGEMSSSTFFDDYRVPDGDRVGEINGGWAVISEALAHERVVKANIAATLRRLLDDILAEIRAQPPLMRDGGDFSGRAELSRLAARLQAARVLVNAGVRATAVTGGGGRLEAPMAKVLSSLLMEDFCVVSQRMLGSASVLGEHCPDALAGGAIEYTLRLSIMQVVGGGTVDIQRNLIARALGLPRN
jgi:alkylation response protein AidB-like acyl-CoA dehydrogenase